MASLDIPEETLETTSFELFNARGLVETLHIIVDRYYATTGKRPTGICIGALDWYDLSAELSCTYSFDLNKINEFDGIPLIILAREHGIFLACDPADATDFIHEREGKS